MKIIVNIARYLSGALFVFSGLVKAIDPRGLAYKMQEFFEAWAQSGFMKELMEQLGHYALTFSVIMITLEVVIGIALMVGWKKRLATWLLFFMILFFTFLTSYVLFSGKIKACGCFGDCIPLTPLQTFTKDIILLLLSIILLWKYRLIEHWAKPTILLSIVVLATIATVALQCYVLVHLPIKDCLPYKKGNNILELRKVPAGAIPDEYAISFIYQKNDVKKEYTAEALPDSSWEFVERKQKLVKLGKNNTPLINDFTLTTESGADSTEIILSQKGPYFLLFVKDVTTIPSDFRKDQEIINNAIVKNIPIYIVTGQRTMATKRYGKIVIINGKSIAIPMLNCDATALKTAARADITLYKMNGPLVINKWGWKDFDLVGL
ncbi:MAG: BT_3928 family protein [Ferruginibacter sp.]